MKLFLRASLLFITLTFFSATMNAQLQTIDNVRMAVKNGNSNNLSNYMSTSIDLKISTDAGNYSDRQAAVVLQKFFTQNPCRDFKYNHVGATQSSSRYYTIGTYSTNSGSYRVLISYKKSNNHYKIDKIHFDKE